MRKLWYWLPPIALMTVIFYLSSHQRVQVSENTAVQFMIFKSLHLIEYALLYVLTYRAVKNTSKDTTWYNRYLAWLIAVFYGISDEIHQVFVPTREGAMRDVFIDSVGISLAALYIWKLLPQAPKQLKNLARVLEII